MLALALRSFAFYVGYVSYTVLWATLSVLVAWTLPLERRYQFIVGHWTRMVLRWLAATCDIRVSVRGRERLPNGPCVLLVKHQSTWETLWVQTLARPQSTLIKRELLRIPFWGWAFALTRPIAIDRRQPGSALRQLVDQGRDRLRRGMTVTLFPEGTRLPPGQVGRFQLGGAALAVASNAPVVVVAHNAGCCWPARRFLKRPGVIAVEISDPISAARRTPRELNGLCEDWLRGAMERLAAEHLSPRR